MKNLAKIFMVIVVAFAAYSCVADATEDLGVQLEVGQTTITLSLEESRTQLGDKTDAGLYPLLWSEGDAIAVNGVVSDALSAEQAGKSSATFRLNGVQNYPYNVVYPAPAENVEANADGCYPIVFPATQEYVEGNIDGKSVLMYGHAESVNDGLSLTYLTGILRFAIKGDVTLSNMIVAAENGAIAGTYYVDCATGALTAQKESLGGAVTVSFGDGLALSADEATLIHVAVPQGEYGTISIVLNTVDDQHMYAKFNSDGDKQIKAGKVREFTEFVFVNNTDIETNVFEISDIETLNLFAELVATNKFAPRNEAKLVAPIDMTGVEWTPIEGFNYTFNGNDQTITGLTAPLFGSAGANIKDLTLADVNIASNGLLTLGAVACVLTDGSISNCKVSGTINVSNTAATIASGADAYTTVNYGGVVGRAGGDVISCVNLANITVNQVAKSANTVAVHPIIGGVVGYSVAGCVTNCVNGNEAKTAGAINYHDTHATQLYVPHVGGVAGSGASGNISAFHNNTNYGAIDFSANTAGTGELSRNSTTIGGVIATSYHNVENNNNYGAITVSGGNIKGFILGGVVGTTTPAVRLYNCHNHQGANITVDSDVVFWAINVAGVVGVFSTNTAKDNYVDTCTNDAPIHVKASTDTNATANGSQLYRVGGVITYANNTVKNCENKANGDITVEGNITLLRANNQPGFGVVGVSCYHTSNGSETNLINRGDINVYTNVTPTASWNTTDTHQTYGKIDIAGVCGYNTKAKRDFQNYGNITIGRAEEAISITGNGLHIGGLMSYVSGAVGVTNLTENINKGKITIINATLCGTFTPTIGETANPWTTCIGGIAAYPTGNISKSKNEGAISLGTNATIATAAYIGGVSGKVVDDTLSAVKNSGAMNIGGAVTGGITYVGGIVGNTTGAITTSENSGAINVSATTSAQCYAGGIVGYTTGALTTVSNTASGTITTSGTFGNTTCIGGAAGYTGAGVPNGVINAAAVTVEGTISAGNTHIGGIIGYMAGASLANSSNTGNVTYNASTNVGYMNIGGGVGFANVAATFDTCFNKGVVSILKGSYVKSHTRIGGMLGYANAALTVKDCYNDMPADAEFGVINSRVNPAGHIRVGGLVGMTNKAFTVHENSTRVYNNAGVCYDGEQNTTSGLSIGGLIGLPNGAITAINGKVYNSGNIYYAGVCYQSTLIIGGCFGTMGTSVPTMGEGAELINIGDITAVQNEANSAFPNSKSKKGSIGGISGAGTGALVGAQSYFKLKIIGDVGSDTMFGMIRGTSNDSTISNCQVGGTICSEQTNNQDVTLTNDNFFSYIYGGSNPASAAEANGCTLLTSAPSVE